jgi:3-deoxy-D-manno-octulosonic-acid transferase
MGRGALAVGTAHRLYRGLARLALPAALAWLWWRGRREPAYVQRLPERLGYGELPPEATGGILVHAASMGEVQAARPLLEALRHHWPDHALTVSTITPTGMQTLRDHWGDVIRHVYLPLDTPGAVRRFLDRLQPRLVLLIEREIWPELMLQCRQRGIPVALINARLSERSARGYRRWPGLFAPIWAQLVAVAAADPESMVRYQGLGVPAGRCACPGNLKFDIPVPDEDGAEGRPAGLAGRTVVVAGSTHAGEEEALLAHWPALWRRHPRLLLVLVPRHPQRFEDVARRLEASGLPFVRHSRGQLATEETAIWLGDTLGHLPWWYRHADLCFIGGSLDPIGGHNALEAMVYGKPVLFGPHTRNFAYLYDLVEASGAGVRVPSGEALARCIDEACADMHRWQAMGQRGAAIVRQHRGATERTLAQLAPLWAGDAPEALARIAVRRQGRSLIWHDPQVIEDVAAADFEAPQPHAGARPMATGSGRGQVHVVDIGRTTVLLRHYRRGGLVARLSRDRFVGLDPRASRAMREYLLLRLMRSWRLPVPVPLAARVEQRGPTYRNDIMVGLLPGTRNLVQLMAVSVLPPEAWHAVGRAIRALHDRQVYHSDLNAHNLLLDERGQAWIVDFDKCGVRAGEDWKAANLARLRRSLRKEKGRQPVCHWREETDWPALLAGYRGEAPPPAA